MKSDLRAGLKCEWPSCSRAYRFKSELEHHVNVVHKKIKRYHCSKCSFGAYEKSTLKNHTDVVHLQIKKLSCKLCDFRTSDKSALDAHILRHLGENGKQFECDQCTYYCRNKADLQKHIVQVHSDLRPFGCTSCDYKAKTKLVLLQHEKTHIPEALKKLQCSQCSYKSSFTQRLLEHMETHKRDEDRPRPFNCTQCPYAATSSSALRSHKRSHNSEKGFSCSKCDFTANQSHGVKAHFMLVHTDVRPFPCNVPGCDSKFMNNSLLQNHIRIVHNKEFRYQCHLCPYKCYFKSVFVNHARIHACEKIFKCTQCDYSSVDKNGLKSHMSYRHNLALDYECQTCGARFKNKDILRGHQKTHSDARELVCQHCPYRGSTKFALAAHVGVNHKETINYRCSKCPYTTTKRKRFGSHVITHEEAKIKCPLCPRKFRRKGEMSSHIQTHTGEKPYKCPQCEFSTRSNTSLTSHMKRPHVSLSLLSVRNAPEQLSCKLCDFKCKTTTSLRWHGRVHQDSRPYPCKLCAYRGISQYSLQQHWTNHHDLEARSHKCQKCQRGYTHLNTLRAHERVCRTSRQLGSTTCSQAAECTPCFVAIERLASSDKLATKPQDAPPCRPCYVSLTRLTIKTQ